MPILKSKANIWFSLSIFFAIYFAVISLQYAFSQDYLIQDDGRIHIVWLQRFIDPELFPEDFIADYFVYFAPWGLKTVYWLGAKLGLAPLFLAKILPAILGLVASIYCYYFTLAILPRHFSAFLSSLMLTQLMWTNDDLISATPRAFIYPFFAAFLYYLATEKLLFCLLAMLLMGLFYPQVLLVEMATLGFRLIQRREGKGLNVVLTGERQRYIWFFLGLIVTAIALFPFSQRAPEWSVVSAQQMQDLPEFNLNGRTFFYGVSWLKFILAGDSGLCLPNFPPIIWLGFALPWFLSKPFATIKALTSKTEILGQTILASLTMYVLAHLLLLKIHLPSRYTYHTLRFVLAIAFAIVGTALVEQVKTWRLTKSSFSWWNKLVAVNIVAIFTIALIFPMMPIVTNGWLQNWYQGKEPEIYEYLAQQPKNTLVASLSHTANNIPAFSLRSILVSEEFAFPYHPHYHQEIKQRAKDLITAQYATEPKELLNFISKYDVNFILLDKNSFIPGYLARKNWLVYSSWQTTTQDAMTKIENREPFVLSPLVVSCTVVTTEKVNLLDTKCIRNQL